MAFGFTYTLPTISGTHTDFVVRMKTADFPAASIDGTGDALDNGGGNLRAYTDSGKLTQLSVEIVFFVSSGSPDADVRIEIPSGFTGATIYIEADSVETTQPAVGAAFGRNSVWANDLRSYPLEESAGSTAVDSTGNSDGTYEGSLPTPGANFGQDFDGTDDNVTTTNDSIDFSAFTFSVKINSDTIGATQQIYTQDKTSGTQVRTWQWRIDSSGTVRILGFDSGGSIIFNSTGSVTLSANTTYLLHWSFDGSNYKTFVDGVVDLNIAVATNIRALQTEPPRIGGRFNVTVIEEFNGEIGDLVVRDGAFKSDSFIATEADNQLSVGAWGSVGSWADSGSGVTVTALLNSNYMVEYSMKKNVASQSIGAQMVTISDGSDFTGTVTAEVTIDNGTKTAGAGSVTHEGEGYHSYAPTQAETNGDHIAVSFAGTGALTQTIQVYTTFPQTVDNDTKISLIPTTAMRGTDSANTVVPPSVAQFNARTLVSADYFDPAADTVANVTLVATTTTNTDMRGTNSALLASGYTAPDNAGITQTQADIAALNDITVVEILTTQMTESYAGDGTAPTLAQSLFLTMQNLQDFSFSGTTQTVKKLDGSTTAATYTLDDAVTPTSKTRAT